MFRSLWRERTTFYLPVIGELVRTIEDVLQPQAADSPAIEILRSTMHHDHFTNRITLDKSVQNPLHVLSVMLDPR